ncbi:type 4a pilus biogenesis protein PilO [Caldanaerobacter subterraneus]|uniref:type 4a pilus biogenesis protein PilO n=1 Tax=Caldanaerobacter subterraneus TaxID=911092 RepID=UPI003463E446
MKLTKREKFLIYFALVFAFFAIYYQFYLIPKLSEIDNLSQEIKLKRQILSQVSSLKGENLQKSLAKWEKEVEELNAILPDEKDAEFVILDLQRMASDSGVKIRSINFENASQEEKNKEQKEEFAVTPISVTAFGSYDGLISFMKSLQESRRLLTIQSFEMQKDQNSENLFLNVLLFAYSMKDSGAKKAEINAPKGKANPFQPLEGKASGESITESPPPVDVNKVISDTLEKILKEAIPSKP